MKLELLTCLACLFVAIPISAENSCKVEDLSKDVAACLRGYQKAMVNMAASDIESYCQNSAAEEVNCTETLVADCIALGDNMTTYFLGLNDTMTIICDNTEALSQNQHCIQAALPGVKTCAVEATDSYRFKILSLIGQMLPKGYKWFKDMVQHELCNLDANIRQCRSVFHDKCGEKVGGMFIAIDHVTFTPTCRQEASIIG